MIRTDFTRQVAIKHRAICNFGIVRGVPQVEETWITTYKQQRAWDIMKHGMATFVTKDIFDALLAGKEVDGFLWQDIPIVEEE